MSLDAHRGYDKLWSTQGITKADFAAARPHLPPDSLMPGSAGEYAFVHGFTAARRGDAAPPLLRLGGGAEASAAAGYQAGQRARQATDAAAAYQRARVAGDRNEMMRYDKLHRELTTPVGIGNISGSTDPVEMTRRAQLRVRQDVSEKGSPVPSQRLYRYGMTLRPPGGGGTPRGEVVEERAADPRFAFGSVAYREKLPKNVADQFSMVPVHQFEARQRLLPRILSQMRTANTMRRMETLERRYQALGGDPNGLPEDIQDRIVAISEADYKARQAAPVPPKPKPPTYREVTTKRGGTQLSFLNPRDTIYRGQLLVKDSTGRYLLMGHAWGDQPGEQHRFRTLRAAKAFIDRMADEWSEKPPRHNPDVPWLALGIVALIGYGWWESRRG